MTNHQQVCRQLQGLLDALLAGSLSPEDEQRVRIHLETCEDCQQELWALRLGRQAHEVLTPEPGYELELAQRRRQVLARLPAPVRGRRPAWTVVRWWWVGAAAAAMVAAALLWQPVPSPPEEGPGRPEVQAPSAEVVPPPEHAEAAQEKPEERQVTEVRLFVDGVQIVWIFDSQFEP